MSGTIVVCAICEEPEPQCLGHSHLREKPGVKLLSAQLYAERVKERLRIKVDKGGNNRAFERRVVKETTRERRQSNVQISMCRSRHVNPEQRDEYVQQCLDRRDNMLAQVSV